MIYQCVAAANFGPGMWDRGWKRRRQTNLRHQYSAVAAAMNFQLKAYSSIHLGCAEVINEAVILDAAGSEMEELWMERMGRARWSWPVHQTKKYGVVGRLVLFTCLCFNTTQAEHNKYWTSARATGLLQHGEPGIWCARTRNT